MHTADSNSQNLFVLSARAEKDRHKLQETEFKPLTREDAQRWRATQVQVPVWWFVKVQVLMGCFSAVVGWLLTQQAAVAWSVLYGSAAVVLPSALMAYGVTFGGLSRRLPHMPQAMLIGFLLWEIIKIAVAVLMLWLAPAVVRDLSWLGLVVGLVLTLKVYWFGFWIRARSSKCNA